MRQDNYERNMKANNNKEFKGNNENKNIRNPNTQNNNKKDN